MQQRTLGKTGLQVSALGLGTAELGAIYGVGADMAVLPDDEAQALLRAAWECGITLWDTAGVYGLSEARIGRFCRENKARPVVATKLAVSAAGGEFVDYATERRFPSVKACVNHQVSRSLLNLQVDAVDVMQLHGLPTAELFDEVAAALVDEVAAGRVRFLGASCMGGALPALLAAGCFGVVELRYNILDQAERAAAFAQAAAANLGVLVRSPLALGLLAGKLESLPQPRREEYQRFLEQLQEKCPAGMSPAQAALHFVLAQPAVSSVLIGSHKADNIRKSAAAGDGAGLPPATLAWLYQLWESKQLPAWTFMGMVESHFPPGAHQASVELCREVDIA